MSVPDIKMLRIDERLMHGQGQMWLNSLGVNLVIVADDDVSKNKLQQTLMKAVVPKSVGMRFFTIEKTCEVIFKAAPEQKIFIVCKSPAEALRLVKGGVPVKEINIGNIHNKPGKEMVTRSIFLGDEDKASIKEMVENYQIKFNTKTTPLGNDGAALVDITKYI